MTIEGQTPLTPFNMNPKMGIKGRLCTNQSKQLFINQRESLNSTGDEKKHKDSSSEDKNLITDQSAFIKIIQIKSEKN